MVMKGAFPHFSPEIKSFSLRRWWTSALTIRREFRVSIRASKVGHVQSPYTFQDGRLRFGLMNPNDLGVYPQMCPLKIIVFDA